MLRQLREIIIRRQQCQVMTNAEPAQQSVNRADLHAALAAMIAEVGSGNVVLTIRGQQWKRGKAINDLVASFRAGSINDQTLVSTNKLNVGIALSCNQIRCPIPACRQDQAC